MLYRYSYRYIYGDLYKRIERHRLFLESVLKACRVVGRDVEFETATQSERVNPDWDFEHVMEAYPAGEPLLFEVIGEDAVELLGVKTRKASEAFQF